MWLVPEAARMVETSVLKIFYIVYFCLHARIFVCKIKRQNTCSRLGFPIIIFFPFSFPMNVQHYSLFQKKKSIATIYLCVNNTAFNLLMFHVLIIYQ
jgi:hypothetical protein